MYLTSDLAEGEPGRVPVPDEGVIERVARTQRDELLRECAGLQMLEWLDRFSPAERVIHWEKVLRVLPRLFTLKAEVERRRAARSPTWEQGAAMLAETMAKMGYPKGYVLGSEADETARARCRLAKARWEFCAANCYGTVGRRLRFERAASPAGG
jgi:hypothetical protein